MDLSSLDSTLPPALADAERDMGDKFRGKSYLRRGWMGNKSSVEEEGTGKESISDAPEVETLIKLLLECRGGLVMQDWS